MFEKPVMVLEDCCLDSGVSAEVSTESAIQASAEIPALADVSASVLVPTEAEVTASAEGLPSLYPHSF